MNRTPPTRGDLSGIVLTKAPKRSLVADIAARPATEDPEEVILEPRQTPEPAQRAETAADTAPSSAQASHVSPAPMDTAAAAPPAQQAPAPAPDATQPPVPEPAAQTAPEAPPVQSARVLADSLPGRPAQQAPSAPAPQYQPPPAPPVAAPQPAQQEPPARKRVADTKMKQTIRMDEADNKRAKRAFNATRHLHGLRNWEDFVARALMKEVLNLEEKYNEGQEFHATEELPKGRPLNM